MREDITKTAGIDTGKTELTLGFWPRGERHTAANTPEGFASLIATLRKHASTRVGIESTSIYHQDVAAALRAAGFTVLVLQPGQVKAFARMQNIKVKRDPSDSELVAGTAAGIEREHSPQAPEIAALAEHLTFLEQAEDNCARLKTQIERFKDPALIEKKKREIAMARLAIRTEVKLLETELRKHPALASRLDLVISVPGIGLRSGLAAVIRMPELGTLGREKAAALLGVAPLDDQSGERDSPRRIQAGRARARKSLFMAAFAGAMQHNPMLKAFYKNLIEHGKPHTLALIACTRKLIILLDAILRRGTPWQDTWEQKRGMPCPA